MLDSDFDSFAARLRLTRTAKGLTQTAFGALVGMKPAQVNRYENGKNVPRDRVLADLAQSLGVRREWLLHGTGPRGHSGDPASDRPLKVTTLMLPEGGTEITFVLYDELRVLFIERAAREGLSLEAFMRNALLELAKERGEEVHIKELARRLSMLSTAEDPQPLKTPTAMARRGKKKPTE